VNAWYLVHEILLTGVDFGLNLATSAACAACAAERRESSAGLTAIAMVKSSARQSNTLKLHLSSVASLDQNTDGENVAKPRCVTCQFPQCCSSPPKEAVSYTSCWHSIMNPIESFEGAVCTSAHRCGAMHTWAGAVLRRKYISMRDECRLQGKMSNVLQAQFNLVPLKTEAGLGASAAPAPAAAGPRTQLAPAADHAPNAIGRTPKVEHRNSRATRRGPMDEMRQLIRILAKLMPNSEIYLRLGGDDNGGNRVSEDQIRNYLSTSLGEAPQPEWGLPQGWGQYLADLFNWATGLDSITADEARRCAKRGTGRPWEAVWHEVHGLGALQGCR
jgi:hypothetical protein